MTIIEFSDVCNQSKQQEKSMTFDSVPFQKKQKRVTLNIFYNLYYHQILKNRARPLRQREFLF